MNPLDQSVYDLGHTIDVWNDDESAVVEVLAAAKNTSVARAAYEAAIKTRPNMIVKLRQKSLLMEKYVPERLKGK